MESEKKSDEQTSEFWSNLGKLMLDISKLTFASFILGGILNKDVPQDRLIIVGIVVFMVFATVGLVLTSRKKNRG